MAKVTVTVTYDYEGDAENAEDAQKEEFDSWTSGSVGVEDIVAAGGNHTVTVTVTDFETAEAE